MMKMLGVVGVMYENSLWGLGWHRFIFGILDVYKQTKENII